MDNNEVVPTTNADPVSGLEPEVLTEDAPAPEPDVAPEVAPDVAPETAPEPEAPEPDVPESDAAAAMDKTGDVPPVVVIQVSDDYVNPNTPRSPEARDLVNQATQTLQAVPDTVQRP